MKAYFDSGVLVKLYVPEPDSARAAEMAREAGTPLVFTDLHDLEVGNALRLKCARKELSDADVRKALHRIDDDVNNGVIVRTAFEWPDVFRDALRLSERFTKSTMTRSLDILHVALAHRIGARDFYSLDRRQRDLARNAGLRVMPG